MFHSILRNYAQISGFKTDKKVIYGIYRDFILTMKDNGAYVTLSCPVTYTDTMSRGAITSFFLDTDVKRKYGVTNYQITDSVITAVFANNSKGSNYLINFIEGLINQMESLSIKGASVCSYCNQKLDGYDDSYAKINDVVYPMHSTCIRRTAENLQNIAEQTKQSGSVITGSIGAVLGAFIGAIPWAIAYYFGWFVGWLGFLIAFAAKKGYELFKGKETKAKAFVIIIVVALTVVFAEFATLWFSWVWEFSKDAELAAYDFSIFEIGKLLIEYLRNTPGDLTSVLFDIALGWLFAGLGIASTIRDIFQTADIVNSAPEEVKL